MIHTTQTHKIGDNVELMREMEPETFHTIITSPPYWGLRDYGVDGQIGLEPTLEEYHTRMLEVTAECMRVLKPTGVMFWNHGDSYGGSGNASGHTEDTLNCGKKTSDYGATRGHTTGFMPKCMLMQNERLIIKMIDNQCLILRNRIIWNKPNGMPSSVADRFSNKYEPVYMLVKSKKYLFDLDAVRVPHKEASTARWCKGGEDTDNTKFNKSIPETAVGNLRNASNPLHPLGKNPGDVWTIPTQPYSEAHFATFPTALIEPMIKAACPEGGMVLDPFCGSGTVLEVCRLLNRNAIGLELNPDYGALIKERSMSHTPPLTAY